MLAVHSSISYLLVVCLFTMLAFRPPVGCLSIHSHLSIHLSTHYVCWPSIHLLDICQSICLVVVCPSICLLVVCQSICLSMYLSTHYVGCLSTCYICPSICLLVVCQSFCFLTVFIYLFVCILCNHLTICSISDTACDL